jgi:integrase
MSVAVCDQRISRNPCDGVLLPRLPDHRQRFLTMAEVQDLVARAGAYRLMILVLGLCGLRFGECAALRVRSVDLMRRRLWVSESVSEVNGHMIWSTPKTHQSRDAPIPRSLIDALVAQAAGKKPEDVLFSSPNGEPVRLANWRQRVLGPSSRRGRPHRTYASRPSTHRSVLGNRVWRVGETRTADARPQGRGDDIECLRVAV